MSITDQIKKDRLEAKRSGDPVAKRRADILTTLLSEIERMEKCDRGNDVKVIAVINKYMKGLDDMIQNLDLNPMESIDDRMKFNDIAFEQETIMKYRPRQLEGIELEDAVKRVVEESGAKTAKDMGMVMGIMKEKYDGCYDGKQASTIVRRVLNGS